VGCGQVCKGLHFGTRLAKSKAKKHTSSCLRAAAKRPELGVTPCTFSLPHLPCLSLPSSPSRFAATSPHAPTSNSGFVPRGLLRPSAVRIRSALRFGWEDAKRHPARQTRGGSVGRSSDARRSIGGGSPNESAHPGSLHGPGLNEQSTQPQHAGFAPPARGESCPAAWYLQARPGRPARVLARSHRAAAARSA